VRDAARYNAATMPPPPPEDLVFDIETVPERPFAELTPEIQAYLAQREGDGLDAADKAADKLALSAGTGRVACICLRNSATGGFGALVVDPARADPDAPWRTLDFTDLDGQPAPCKAFYGSEAQVLAAFWEAVDNRHRRTRLVSYNGRGFDGPFVALRSLRLGVVPTRNLTPYRYSHADHADLMDVITAFGAARQTFSLAYWCAAFGIPSPKSELSGAGVADAVAAGRLDDVVRYCLSDVDATWRLYGKLRPLMDLQAK